MSGTNILLLDREAHTASMLVEELASRGFGNVRRVGSGLDLPAAVGQSVPDIVIFNYHADQPESLAACGTIRLMAPLAAIVALASPGPAMKAVRDWSGEGGCIDAVVEKPIFFERFFATLDNLRQAQAASRKLQSQSARLSGLVPEGALLAAESESGADGELFEAAVLFTDIRGSSGLIRSMATRDFFALLNDQLSTHSRLITRFEGSVVKYTGDGVMAIFRGMGKSYLALRCALELARTGAAAPLPFGTGVAQGLVLAGLIGDFNRAGQRRQYDVIGATVHLAARLCSMADAGEAVTTRNLNAIARITTPPPRHLGRVSIKGFERDVDCVAFSFKQSLREPGT